jgi:hypothetical protein
MKINRKFSLRNALKFGSPRFIIKNIVLDYPIPLFKFKTSRGFSIALFGRRVRLAFYDFYLLKETKFACLSASEKVSLSLTRFCGGTTSEKRQIKYENAFNFCGDAFRFDVRFGADRTRADSTERVEL